MRSQQCSCLRSRVIEFLIQSAHLLEVSPIVKYSALSLLADRFYPVLVRFLRDGKSPDNWLLLPLRESNLQLFGLISIWVSSKMHDTPPLCIKNLKPLADKYIKEQHFTTRDLLEAKIKFFKVIEFGIGVTNIAFNFVEELLIQLREVARVGEHVKFEACMDIMDLLYEKEETSVLYRSPRSLAASILVAAYLITVPKRKWEFPVLPWVKFVTSCKEEEVVDCVRYILNRTLEYQPL
ncbi:Hypothetical predicted protein [Olea europaea subsp. europaea]|uniref:Uncharacterized protein n=1 Tax=Olea europaea subsp. europaea TaxID=158383 RepID=A0A8S0T113_OLEEU|nr:Hypothetical predicted protein [Olea europaea subsp. europaea]